MVRKLKPEVRSYICTYLQIQLIICYKKCMYKYICNKRYYNIKNVLDILKHIYHILLSYIHIENKKEIGESYLREHNNRGTVHMSYFCFDKT